MRAPVKLRRPVAAVALGLALVAVAVGCSSSSGSSDSSTTTTSAAGGSTTTSAAPGGTGVSGSSDAQALMGLLLTAPEVGPGFSAQAPTSRPPSTTPSPCGTPSPDIDFPPVLNATVEMTAAGVSARFEEQINVYASAADATGAVGVAAAGMACGQGTIPGTDTQFAITGPVDLTGLMGTDAVGWDIATAPAALSLIVAQVGDSLVVTTFEAPDAAGLSALDPITVTQTAVAKLMAG